MALTQVDQGLLGTYAQYTGFKNRIYNGQMQIDQRNAGASVSADNSFPVDRFKISISGSATATSQRSTTTPSGFTNSVIYTIGTGSAQGTSGVYRIFQNIEGFNTADFGWGASGAATVTLSFWVRSSITGTFAGGLIESNGGTASYVFNYTINAANTWEYKTVTVAGPTIGTWQTGSSASIAVVFDLGSGTNFEQSAGSWTSSSNRFRSSGAVVLSATSGATFYITGVQLEKGSTATSFDYRPYGTELALCQRYYEKSYDQSVAVGAVNSNGVNSTVAYQASLNRPFWSIKFGVTKRTSASVTLYTPNTLNTSGKIGGPSGADVNATVTNAGDSTFSLYQAGTPPSNSADYYAHWTASAEL